MSRYINLTSLHPIIRPQSNTVVCFYCTLSAQRGVVTHRGSFANYWLKNTACLILHQHYIVVCNTSITDQRVLLESTMQNQS